MRLSPAPFFLLLVACDDGGSLDEAVDAPAPLACGAPPELPAVAAIAPVAVPADACAATQIDADGARARALYFDADGRFLAELQADVDVAALRSSVVRDAAGRPTAHAWHHVGRDECVAAFAEAGVDARGPCAAASDDGRPAGVRAYEYDAAGRLVRYAHDFFSEGRARHVVEFAYDGDATVLRSYEEYGADPDTGKQTHALVAQRIVAGLVREERACIADAWDTYEEGFARVLADDRRTARVRVLRGRSAIEAYDDGLRRVSFDDGQVRIENDWDADGRPLRGAYVENGVVAESLATYDDAAGTKRVEDVGFLWYEATHRFGAGLDFQLRLQFVGEGARERGAVVDACPDVAFDPSSVPWRPGPLRTLMLEAPWRYAT